MARILIIGPTFFNFISACRHGFEKLGFEVVTEEYDNPVHPFRGVWKIMHKLARDKETVRKKNRKVYQPHIITVFNHVKPDFVFCLNGDMLSDDTLDYFRGKCKVAIWMFDRVTTVKVSQSHVDHCDAFFCYDLEDVHWYEEKGKKVYFLPQACDSRVYYPIAERKKDIDILFVGNIYTSNKRKQLLNLVADKYPDRRILFVGEYIPFVKSPIACLFRKRRGIFTNNNIPSSLVNEYYNRAKIALNIHSEQQKNGANPRLFEIAGTDTYQLCDANPYIESLFCKGEVGLYHDGKELIELIHKSLDSDMSSYADAAYRSVLSNHTFDKRMETVINIISSL